MKSDPELWGIMKRLAATSDTDPNVWKKRGAILDGMTLKDFCRASDLCAVPGEDTPRHLDLAFLHHFFRTMFLKLAARILIARDEEPPAKRKGKRKRKGE